MRLVDRVEQLQLLYKMHCCGKNTVQKGINIAKGFTALAVGKKYEFTDGRVRVCQGCSDHYKIGRVLFCKICKCNVPAKARVKEETCPADRWPDYKGVKYNGE